MLYSYTISSYQVIAKKSPSEVPNNIIKIVVSNRWKWGIPFFIHDVSPFAIAEAIMSHLMNPEKMGLIKRLQTKWKLNQKNGWE